ncbi:hypothetical protein ACFFQF_04165 [Haladaptatus pallidirubidus]|uniref:hypothetical protein n=1 Tax=Haladaptatus pallidirubidus TaxID=1008152 RepID=UPI0035E4BDB5
MVVRQSVVAPDAFWDDAFDAGEAVLLHQFVGAIMAGVAVVEGEYDRTGLRARVSSKVVHQELNWLVGVDIDRSGNDTDFLHRREVSTFFDAGDAEIDPNPTVFRPEQGSFQLNGAVAVGRVEFDGYFEKVVIHSLDRHREIGSPEICPGNIPDNVTLVRFSAADDVRALRPFVGVGRFRQRPLSFDRLPIAEVFEIVGNFLSGVDLPSRRLSCSSSVSVGNGAFSASEEQPAKFRAPTVATNARRVCRVISNSFNEHSVYSYGLFNLSLICCHEIRI